MRTKIVEDWLDNHLYISAQFNGWLTRVRKIERVYQLEELTIEELLDSEGITIPRLKRIIKFMSKNGLAMKMSNGEAFVESSDSVVGADMAEENEG